MLAGIQERTVNEKRAKHYQRNASRGALIKTGQKLHNRSLQVLTPLKSLQMSPYIPQIPVTSVPVVNQFILKYNLHPCIHPGCYTQMLSGRSQVALSYNYFGPLFKRGFYDFLCYFFFLIKMHCFPTCTIPFQKEVTHCLNDKAFFVCKNLSTT